jgi:hypothetical protein
MAARKILVTGFLATASLLALASEAEARPTIKNPNDHPEYRAELEPHANFILWHGSHYGRGRYGKYRGFGDPEFGGGFRATIEIADPAFIPKINNTVGITFGIDFTNCRYCDRRQDFTVWNPVGLQWNFFFTDKFSAFADLGFMLRSGGFYNYVDADFFAMVGGRYHFNDKVALTFRLGQPFVSLGVSFFVGS